ncbi:MAG: tetratricopeptide repeat protein [Planctomycetales bacterium]|nr:tetratricopeptide repeat protein [Planctomycetales bacterium]
MTALPDPPIGEPGHGAVSLADFGLAKLVATGSRLTRTGQALGTPSYMSPEQARGEVSSLTPATDVWSLGCVLHEALAGSAPFDGETAAAIVGRVLLESPPAIRRLRPDVPATLERVLRVALARSPRDRYADGAPLRDDLDRVLRGERPRARVPGAWPRAAMVAGAGLALFAAAVLSSRLVPGPDRAAAPSLAAEPIAAGPKRVDDSILRAARLRSADPAAAAEWLGAALTEEPGRHDLRIERGLLLWAVGRGEEARAEWVRVPAGAPERPEALLWHGLEAAFRLEGHGLRLDQADPELAEAARAPGRVGRLASAALAVARAEFGRARERLRNEEGWEASLLRAFVEQQDPSGDRPAAVREYGRAIAEGIPFAWVRNNRGTLRHDLGDAAGAMEDLDAALRLRPGFPHALHNRGLAFRSLGQPARALQDFDEVLRQLPRSFTTLSSRGAARGEMGDLAGAMADLDEALRLAPGFIEARFNRAAARTHAGDLRGAFEDYDVIVRVEPGHAEALDCRGDVRRQLGDPEGAIADHTAALRLRPDFPVALQRRAQAREALGDLAGAERDLDEALRAQPDFPEALNSRASVRIHLDDVAAAARDAESALRLRPGFAAAHVNLGTARKLLGDWDAAAANFREFLRLAPGHRVAPAVRGELAECERRLRGEATEGR